MEWLAVGVTLRVLDRVCFRLTAFFAGEEFEPSALMTVDPILCE